MTKQVQERLPEPPPVERVSFIEQIIERAEHRFTVRSEMGKFTNTRHVMHPP